MTPETSASSLFQRRVYGTLGITVLVSLYLLVGLTGHDPWRGDDARYFGPVLSMLRDEGWLFPMLAGEPLSDYPPLYYWVSALLARLAEGMLAPHDGARLASAAFVAMGVYFTARAAESLYGRPARTPAALLAMSSLGLVLHAHETQPLLALFAMLALTLRGLALVPAQPLAGALIAGAGGGFAFLAAGLSGLLLTLPLFALMMFLSPECRNPRANGALLLGLCLAGTIAALWPLAVHLNEPELFSLWLQQEWRHLGRPWLRAEDWLVVLELFGWFTWPLWPLTLWGLWRGRREFLAQRWLLPVLGAILVLIWIGLRNDLSQVNAVPLLPAMALLAAGGVPSLRRGAANAFDWFALMSLAIFGLLVWLAWTAQAVGWPPGLARHVARTAPDFVLPASELQLALGIAISLIWALLLWKLPRSTSRAAANWAIGLTMLWCLAVVLLMPWFDHDRSYRRVARSLQIAVAGERQLQPDLCIARTELPDALRSSLDYFAGLRTVPARGATTACSLLLITDERRLSSSRLAPGWQTVWEFRRGGGRRQEVFRLLRRDLPDPS